MLIKYVVMHIDHRVFRVLNECLLWLVPAFASLENRDRLTGLQRSPFFRTVHSLENLRWRTKLSDTKQALHL